MILLTCLVAFSSVSFLLFGSSCFTMSYMKLEFLRYGLGEWRIVVGILQILGAVGLILGYFYSPLITIIASGGLSILMILGFGVRMKIKDSVVQSAPSLTYAIINAAIVIMVLKNINSI